MQPRARALTKTLNSRENSPESVSRDEHARRVRAMFGRIAGRYDLLNHLLSGNVDKGWRRLVARTLSSSLAEGARVLDVACGTGGLSVALAAAGGAKVVGLDFC